MKEKYLKYKNRYLELKNKIIQSGGEGKLLEICCKCGFVHRDDRISYNRDDRISYKYRQYKPHYHWIPIDGEVIHDNITLHATICVACCDTCINWKEFFEQKKMTPEKYRVKWSLNAPLPERLLEWASELYTLQSTYFQFN